MLHNNNILFTVQRLTHIGLDVCYDFTLNMLRLHPIERESRVQNQYRKYLILWMCYYILYVYNKSNRDRRGRFLWKFLFSNRRMPPPIANYHHKVWFCGCFIDFTIDWDARFMTFCVNLPQRNLLNNKK